MSEYAQAWGRWLGDFRWTYAATLTSRRPMTPAAAAREMTRFLRDLGRRCRRRVPWFYAMERTCAGQVHIHALLDADLGMSSVKAAWQPGQSKVEAFDPARGWCYYITKDIGDRAVAWDIDRRASRQPWSTIDSRERL